MSVEEFMELLKALRKEYTPTGPIYLGSPL